MILSFKRMYCNFRWNDRVHGGTAEPFWIWVEDPETNHIYHHEYLLLTKKQVGVLALTYIHSSTKMA
jgi:hypothetical protein